MYSPWHGTKPRGHNSSVQSTTARKRPPKQSSWESPDWNGLPEMLNWTSEQDTSCSDQVKKPSVVVLWLPDMRPVTTHFCEPPLQNSFACQAPEIALWTSSKGTSSHSHNRLTDWRQVQMPRGFYRIELMQVDSGPAMTLSECYQASEPCYWNQWEREPLRPHKAFNQMVYDLNASLVQVFSDQTRQLSFRQISALRKKVADGFS